MSAAAVEKTIISTPTGKPADHEWIGAAEVDLTLKDAKRADLRGSYRTAVETQVHVLEVYCRNCRRPFEQVAGVVCEASKSKDHLIGGVPGTRARRTGHGIPGHDCVKLGCNTGIALAAQRQEAARRNGVVTDVRQRPAPPRPEPLPSYVQVQPVPRPVPAQRQAPRDGQLASVTYLDPQAQAREAGRILAAMRGRKRVPPPGALPLW